MAHHLVWALEEPGLVRGPGPLLDSTVIASIIDPRGSLEKSQGRGQARQIYSNATHNESEVE